MNNELTRETLVLGKSAGKEKTQLLHEGDIIAPDIKPDIAVVLRVDADAFVEKKEVLNDKVTFTCKLVLQTLYLAKDTGKAVHSVQTTVNLDGSVNIEGMTKDSAVTLSANVADLSYKMLNDRKITYRVIIDVTASAETNATYDAVTAIESVPLTQQRRRLLSFAKTADSTDDTFTVKDEFPLPLGKPTAAEMLQTKVTVANKEVKALAGRVTITGDIIVSIFYKGVDDDSVIEFVEHEIPFNGTIEMLESKEGMIGDATLKIKDVTTKIKPDADGEDRIIEVEARVFASVKVYGQSEAEILSDAYLINKSISLSKETVSYPQLIFRNKSQCHVKETVNFQDAPEILQILTVSGIVTVDDVTILTDKINANGIINADILYIAKNDDVPIYNYKTIIPFEHVIEAKGISSESGAEVEIEPSIDYSGFNMLGSDEAEIRFIVGLNAKAIKRAEEEIVTDVVVSDMTPEALAKFPSIIIYSVQRGDSLWKVAKRFNTSIDELIAINEIENPDKIYPGQKLVILKNIA